MSKSRFYWLRLAGLKTITVKHDLNWLIKMRKETDKGLENII
jgi:hypothetical protein